MNQQPRYLWRILVITIFMVVFAGNKASAMLCVQAAEIVEALYSTGAGAGSNGIPSDYKPPCKLPPGMIMGIQASESGNAYDNSIVNKWGYTGCGQLGLNFHQNPSYKRGSSTPLNVVGAGNEVPNLLRAGEYLCYLQTQLKTERCDIISTAYNAGEGTLGSGIKLNKTYGKPDTLENILAAGIPLYYPNVSAKTTEALGYAGCTCGGEFKKYISSGRFCKPSGGGIGGAISTNVLIIDQVADVGTGVIEALAQVIGTGVMIFNDHLGPALLSIVMIVYSIMALWSIAKLLMPFGQPGNAGQTFNGLLVLSGTVAIVAFMLSNVSLLTSGVFFPIMNTMTRMGDLSQGACESDKDPLTDKCQKASTAQLSGDPQKDAELLATKMTCTVNTAITPLKESLRIGMASFKRLETNFDDTGIVGKVGGAIQKGGVLGNAIVSTVSEKTTMALRIIVFLSGLPITVLSVAAILGIIAATAQTFWKITFEFFKLAPAVAAFAFRPTRGVFTSSVQAWLGPILNFAIIYAVLGVSSTIACNAPIAITATNEKITLGKNADAYTNALPEAPLDMADDVISAEPNEAAFPVITKNIWMTMTFFALFMNSTLRLATKMNLAGGGGIKGPLSFMQNSVNFDNTKHLAGKVKIASYDTAKNAYVKSKEPPKEEKKETKPDSGGDSGGNSNVTAAPDETPKAT